MLSIFRRYSIARKKATPPQPLSASAYHKLIDSRLAHVKHAVGSGKHKKRAHEGVVAVGYAHSPTYDPESLSSGDYRHPVYEKRSYWPLDDTNYVYATGAGIAYVLPEGELMVIYPEKYHEIKDTAFLHRLYTALHELVI